MPVKEMFLAPLFHFWGGIKCCKGVLVAKCGRFLLSDELFVSPLWFCSFGVGGYILKIGVFEFMMGPGFVEKKRSR